MKCSLSTLSAIAVAEELGRELEKVDATTSDRVGELRGVTVEQIGERLYTHPLHDTPEHRFQVGQICCREERDL